MYQRERPTSTTPQRRKAPSFSSSLLDAIYRSIDEPCRRDQVSGFEADPSKTKKKQSRYGSDGKQGRLFSACNSYSSSSSSNLQRAILIGEWMEKRGASNGGNFSLNLNSASISSSDSTFSSSSETEFSRRSYKPSPKKHAGSGKSLYFDTFGSLETPRKTIHRRHDDGKSFVSGGFTKTKLRAMKIYDELKNLKQPISPGARISSFLNSIFNSGNVKKAKMCYVGAVDDVSFEKKPKPTYSSASRRPCMTKSNQTPPSTFSSSYSSFSGRNKMKRSVRFYPVNVIVGEDSSPCDHIPINENDGRDIPTTTRRSPLDAIKTSSSPAARGFKQVRFEECGEEEDDDAQSCASSDLFELDHLIGVGRYRDELPVYETTCLKKNKAIASGMKKL
ncbi:hypothetical protein SAY86_009426 [Trapa natans]|uniref:Protein BIG GRAIN 1-like B n=1 Tax=Trapa natans TaxID=22666 RepID=A0AAN7KWQ3_TRANT|nr:hypothetical protein SAY86_009426 [Trapa natans]